MEQSSPAAAPDAAASTSPATSPPGTPAFPVVGLGASAGGLPALQTFFDHTPPDTGMAFVVILHLSPAHESQAAALLQSHTAMPVTQVTAPVPLAPNQVYVIPPARQLLMVDGQLRVEEPATEQDRRVPIDHFFRTLADTHDSHAAAVILSGTGSDGALGIRRVKEQGGTILVQDPQEAEWDGMPRSAIATGLVDYVLPVAAMPEMLQAYWRRAGELALPETAGDAADGDEAALRDILALLLVRTKHDFSLYKRPTLLRRIGRRMQVSGATDLAGYLEVLRSRPEEVQALLGDLLISVTNFFRDHDAWTTLETIMPLLFQGKQPSDQVRVWVTACATGEEAYTVAMLLQEHADTLDHPPAIQVFATDIADDALARGRHGSYPEMIVGDVSPERLQRFFVLEQGRYRVKQELRDLILFARHNVLRDPPFSKLDLVTCRNLLIYLNQQAQEQVLRLFHFSLRPGGYLLLGSAESVDGVPGLFDLVAKTQRLFKQHPNPALLPPPGPRGGAPILPGPVRGAGPARSAGRKGLDKLHEWLIVQHASPSILVNEDYEIVHLSPGAGHYLLMEAGEPSYNLLRVAHPDLRLELQTALFQAAQQGQQGDSRHVRVNTGEGARLVDILVEPVAERAGPGRYLFVRFTDVGAATATSAREVPATDAQFVELHAELQRTRERLQLTVEAYEAAGEEYKAANEELTAINEELRAASEELETSKEELQAVNEELSTVNEELKHRVDETTQANNDLQNLIAATEIGTLFLDRELRLTRYTPSVEGIFNLLPTDLRRPLAHITHTLQYDQLAADAREVLQTLQLLEREVASDVGQWYLIQLRPYRTTDDRIAGVVITFIDITERKRTEAALAERARLLDLSNDAIVVRDVDNRIIYWNHGATELYGWTREEALGQDLHRFLRTEFEVPLEQLIATLQQHDRMEGEVVQVTRDGRRIILSSRWALDRDAEGRPGAILTTYNDVTERKQAEASLRESEERYRTLFESIDQGFCVVEVLFDEQHTPHDYRFLEVNPAFEHQTGLAQAVGKRMRELAPQHEAQWFEIYGAVALTGTPMRFEQRAEALQRWFDVYAFRLGEPGSHRVAILFDDITGRKRAEVEREHLLEEAEQARQAAEAAVLVRDQFLSIASHELRTPLSSLMGYASVLQGRLTGETTADATTQRQLSTIVRQASRLNGMIGHLLDVTRLQRGQFVLEQQVVELGALVEEGVEEFRLTLPEQATHTVVWARPDEPVEVLGDPVRLHEVLHNLLGNAVKYSPDGGAVAVRVAVEADAVVLEVADQGIGIPAEAQARLFEPFYRAGNVSSQSSGFGIGLYVVQEVVQRHGGRIEVESTEGAGSRFRIVLPRHTGAA